MPSSVIAGMRYDTRWRVLMVVFRGSGERYHYFEVPRPVWRAFVEAPSKGTFLNETLKPMGLRCERVEGRVDATDGGKTPVWVEVWPPEGSSASRQRP